MGICMVEINYDNVRAIFCRIVGIESEEFPYKILIENAIEQVRGKLIRDLESRIDAARCEYAAAASAVYDYTLEKALDDRVMFSQNGAAYRGAKSSDSLRSAEQFRRSAFAHLHGLILDEDFTFRCTFK